MATITFKGNAVETEGNLPLTGTFAPAFELTGTNLGNVSLKDYAGKNVVLNIFPSIDTGVCAASVRQFNQKAAGLDNTVVICISRDLPFAQNRFCGAEGINNVVMASEYKNDSFSKAYRVKMVSGPLAGLMSRAVVVIAPDGTVKYTEQVPEIAQEPDYNKALSVI